MKTIGLLGGMSYESTLEYYKKINQAVQKKLGNSHSAKIYMYSFDYEALMVLNQGSDKTPLTKRLYEEFEKLKEVGSDIVSLTANTMHLYIDGIEEKIGIPLIHIVDAALDEARLLSLNKVLLLGTSYTMSSSLYTKPFYKEHKEVIVPNLDDQAWINDIIYHELIRGIFSQDSKKRLIDMIKMYQKELGFDGVILGCTELPLLIKKEDIDIPLINTLDAHVNKIVTEIFKD
ncbi:MAG: aspartate racemase [Tenericutes bacterium HGW-Tenericutes-6]|jgi:aspartate racemase|nr:MAG: aspartate racemase [Tenericutes bacterium HGW-Tenericutes-6]